MEMQMPMYRKIEREQIKQLEAQGCRAENWDSVEVADGFTADNIFHCAFRGRIRIGKGVCIANVGAYIANYEIQDGVCIENCAVLETTYESAFGNGVMVAAVNEAGGREVPIYDKLSAQIAYMIAMYRHRPLLVAALEKMIAGYCDSVRSPMGSVGRGSQLRGCRIVRNVKIGESATLEGVDILENVTVNSTPSDPTFLGVAVKGYDSIFGAGSRTDNGSVIRRCYVGEACQIDYNYTAENSLFFANTHCSNGEACSIFAGPYTVSHHKSTLLIAGIFSFFNAGSGSNQSNHLFKTGAVHQGVHERGCKFASDAYIMLPAREGAFTVILGRHKDHHDTALFPFSYLIEEEGKSYLVPAINLRSYGTVRDLKKWPQRNHRVKADQDIVRFEEHNPYIAGKIFQAIEISQKMLAKEGVDTYNYQRVRIKQVMVRRGLNLYKLALASSLGAMLAGGGGKNAAEKGANGAQGNAGRGRWVDMSGMLAPWSMVEELIGKIEAGELTKSEQVAKALKGIDKGYAQYAYAWALERLEMQLGRVPEQGDIEAAVAAGETASQMLRDMAEEDAKKDRDTITKTGYGIDAESEKEIDDDFYAVRGK